jgi:hypothetical protein
MSNSWAGSEESNHRLGVEQIVEKGISSNGLAGETLCCFDPGSPIELPKVSFAR